MAVSDAQIKKFIREFSAAAIAECNRRIAAGLPFVLPSVCMAQSALESSWGTAPIMVRANAYFGIKAGGSWTGKIYIADTWEVAENGERYNTVANFRAYDNRDDSIRDYYSLLTEASRYSKALSYGADRSKWLTPSQTVRAIGDAGYATDNNYYTKMMNTLNGRKLDQYDALITGVGDAALDFPTYPDYKFSKDDLVQGSLIESDAGRTISNDATNISAIALDWSKAPTSESDAMYSATWDIDGNADDYQMTLYLLQGDLPSRIGLTQGASFTVPAGAKFGFFFERAGDAYGTELLIDEIKTINVSFTDTSGLPNGTEYYDGTLAQFIQI